MKERFLKKIRKESNGCWTWTGSKYRNGYGRVYLKRVGKITKNGLAHRIAWIFFRGDIPEGQFVLHHCDNRPCVNPDHLFLGTHQDNMDDMMKKGRYGSKSRGTKNNKHNSKLNFKIAEEIRSKYIPRKYSMIQLGKEYGVDTASIWYVIHNKTWVK